MFSKVVTSLQMTSLAADRPMLVFLAFTWRHKFHGGGGGQLQIDTQSLEGNNFSLYVLNFRLAANMSNFVTFIHSSTV